MQQKCASSIPTLAEFEAAKRRELSRLNLRLSVLMGKEYLTPEDRTILEGDTSQLEEQDRKTVRGWSANKGKRLEMAS